MKKKVYQQNGFFFLIFLVMMITFSLVSCGIPLPESHKELAGVWRNGQVELNIYPQGRVEYYVDNGASTFSLEAPLQEIDGDVLKVGLGKLVRKIHIDKYPWEEDGQIWMVVDGHKLQLYKE